MSEKPKLTNQKKMMIYSLTPDDLREMGHHIDDDDYIDIPIDMITDNRVSAGAFVLYCWVAGKNDSELPDKWYADKMGISMSTLYRYKKELREAGYIN